MVFAISVFASMAVAGHWHDYACGGGCSIWHGFVHGSNSNDNVFWSRVDAHPPGQNGFWTICRLRRNDLNQTYINGAETTYGDACSAGTNGGYYETNSLAKVHSYGCSGCSGDVVPEHAHYPH
jgi:hypothetical protein